MLTVYLSAKYRQFSLETYGVKTLGLWFGYGYGWFETAGFDATNTTGKCTETPQPSPPPQDIKVSS